MDKSHFVEEIPWRRTDDTPVDYEKHHSFMVSRDTIR